MNCDSDEKIVRMIKVENTWVLYSYNTLLSNHGACICWFSSIIIEQLSSKLHNYVFVLVGITLNRWCGCATFLRSPSMIFDKMWNLSSNCRYIYQYWIMVFQLMEVYKFWGISGYSKSLRSIILIFTADTWTIITKLCSPFIRT